MLSWERRGALSVSCSHGQLGEAVFTDLLDEIDPASI